MPVPLRTDFDAHALRAIARTTKDGPQARHARAAREVGAELPRARRAAQAGRRAARDGEQRILGDSEASRTLLDDDRQGRGDRCARADPRRERQRQRARRRGAASAQPARVAAVRARSTAPRFRSISSRTSCSATRAARSPTRRRRRQASSKRRTAARCSSTRSATWSRAAGAAAARDRRRTRAPHRRETDRARQRARHRRHASRPEVDGRRRRVPRGPLLPPRRRADRRAAAARAERRRAAALHRRSSQQFCAPQPARAALRRRRDVFAAPRAYAGRATSASCATSPNSCRSSAPIRSPSSSCRRRAATTAREIGVVRLADGAPIMPLRDFKAQCEKEYIEMRAAPHELERQPRRASCSTSSARTCTRR